MNVTTRLVTRTIAGIVLLILFTPMARAETPKESAIHFRKQKLNVDKQAINVEVAETPDQLERGLMYRKNLGVNDGMIFIFEKDRQLDFWMKNTYVPLSVGFFNHEGVLIDIQEMDAVSQLDQGPFPTYSSHGLAQFALEMNKEWFDTHHILLKARLSPIPKLHKGRD
jgi:uncharacterized membrane protein (UPF0127 family)